MKKRTESEAQTTENLCSWSVPSPPFGVSSRVCRSDPLQPSIACSRSACRQLLALTVLTRRVCIKTDLAKATCRSSRACSGVLALSSSHHHLHRRDRPYRRSPPLPSSPPPWELPRQRRQRVHHQQQERDRRSRCWRASHRCCRS